MRNTNQACIGFCTYGTGDIRETTEEVEEKKEKEKKKKKEKEKKVPHQINGHQQIIIHA